MLDITRGIDEVRKCSAAEEGCGRGSDGEVGAHDGEVEDDDGGVKNDVVIIAKVPAAKRRRRN